MPSTIDFVLTVDCLELSPAIYRSRLTILCLFLSPLNCPANWLEPPSLAHLLSINQSEVQQSINLLLLTAKRQFPPPPWNYFGLAPWSVSAVNYDDRWGLWFVSTSDSSRAEFVLLQTLIAREPFFDSLNWKSFKRCAKKQNREVVSSRICLFALPISCTKQSNCFFASLITRSNYFSYSSFDRLSI